MEVDGERGAGDRVAIVQEERLDREHLEDHLVLAELLRRHGFELDDDSEETPTWGDAFNLPLCLHLREILVAAKAIPRAVGLPATCKLFTGVEDDEWTSIKGFEDDAASRLSMHTPAFRKDLAVERCFRDAHAAGVMGPTTDVLYDFIGKAVCGQPIF